MPALSKEVRLRASGGGSELSQARTSDVVKLCERTYPNYQVFCLKTRFGELKLYRGALDLLWELLLMKDAKINRS